MLYQKKSISLSLSTPACLYTSVISIIIIIIIIVINDNNKNFTVGRAGMLQYTKRKIVDFFFKLPLFLLMLYHGDFKYKTRNKKTIK